MTTSHREYIRYLQDCKIPELNATQVTSEGQKDTAREIERLIEICEEIDLTAQALAKRAVDAERRPKGRSW